MITRRQALELLGTAAATALVLTSLPALAQNVSPADLAVPGPLGDVALGPADAKVTIIEYASMTCPHCAAFHQETWPELKKRWDVPGRSLSGGEQQMVVLAQALVSRPSIVLVDELSLGLAPVVVKRLVPTLAEVAESGVGVLLIEQFAHVALSLANSAYVLEGGHIRYHGTASELREKPELLSSAYLLREQADVAPPPGAAE